MDKTPYLYLGFPSGLFLSDSPTKTWYVFFSSMFVRYKNIV